MNVQGDNTDTINNNTEALIDASKEVGLKVNVEKTKYTLMSHYQNADQNQDIKTANRLFENVSHFKYLGMIVKNQNVIQEEIWRRLKSGHGYHHSVQNLHSSHLLSKNLKIRDSNLPVVLCGCETWSLTLREEHRLNVFEERMLKGIFKLKRNEVMGGRRKLHNEELHDFYSSPITIIKSRRMR
jgi:hypothetical protein